LAWLLRDGGLLLAVWCRCGGDGGSSVVVMVHMVARFLYIYLFTICGG